MRMRIASGVAVLVALGFATLTMARPQGGPPKGQEQANPKAQLQARVARLRAEVELLQLEHDGDVAVLKDMINGLWASEASASMEKIGAPMLEELRKSAGGGGGADNLNRPFAKEFLARFNPEEEARKQGVVDEATAKLLRKMYDQAKGDFLSKAAAFNEKKLELEDLEHRWNAVR